MKIKGYDVIGKIAILKFEDKEKLAEKKKIALKLLKKKNIKTVLEKIGRVKGRLRTLKTRFLAGEKTTETVHVESGCKFKLDVEKCYFSPRLSGERLDIVSKIKNKDRVLVMFAGVAPYSIIIGKKSGARQVVSVELSRIASKYASENIRLNKLENIKVIQGDVKKIIPRFVKKKIKFDKIVMPRPQLRESFLSLGFKIAKRGSVIFYYDFSRDVGKVLERIYRESKKVKKKIKVLKVKRAGEIAPFKFRFRVDFKIL